jgi:phosphoglycerate dehydrogenase-like enzyme
MGWTDEEVDQLRDAFAPAELVVADLWDEASLRAAVEGAQVAVLGHDVPPWMLDTPSLRWVHCDHAGLERTASRELFQSGIEVTSSAGRSAPALAQHGFFFALCFVYDVRGMLATQASHRWDWKETEVYRERGALWGRRLGIVGFGHTGKEMARLGRAFGMHVTVLRRSAVEPSPDVDVMLSYDAGDDASSLIEGSDVIMIAANLSDQTYHMFSTDEFRRMRREAVIINVARGSVIDEPALIEALRSGEIAGAGLDVFEVEPLPASSPLWDMPNVVITQHATPKMPDRTQRSIEMISANLARYRAGQPLINQLTERDLFTKAAGS